MKSLLPLLLTLLLAVPPCLLAADDTRLAGSRAAADALQAELTQRLEAAMAEHGPVAALGVCRDAAPEIGARLSAAAGARVGRTALRIRNPANAPDADARRVLESFDARLRGGERPPLEAFEVRADGSARYLRTIVLQPLCVACHGAELAPPVATVLAQLYPDDEATGFVPGDLRGAFIVDWPAASSVSVGP